MESGRKQQGYSLSTSHNLSVPIMLGLYDAKNNKEREFDTLCTD